jgi:hypothetical protein
MAAMLMRAVTLTITHTTAGTRIAAITVAGITHITAITVTGIMGTGIMGTAPMAAATRRRSLTGAGTSLQGLAAGSQAIIRASGCVRRRERTAW